jgi:hypothetical protein
LGCAQVVEPDLFVCRGFDLGLSAMEAEGRCLEFLTGFAG